MPDIHGISPIVEMTKPHAFPVIHRVLQGLYSNHLFVVMTKHFSKYKEYEISGQLEFTDKSPIELTELFEKKGFQTMVVVGGAHVATSF